MLSSVDSLKIQSGNFNWQPETESEYFIPKSRQSHEKSVISAIMAQRVQEAAKPDVRSSWYQNYTVPDSYVGVSTPNSSVPLGEVISAAEALGWNKSQQGVDIRPAPAW